MIVTVSVFPLTALAPAGGFDALPLHMSMQHRNWLFVHSFSPTLVPEHFQMNMFFFFFNLLCHLTLAVRQ